MPFKSPVRVLVVGLQNMGGHGTRHNVGAMFVEHAARQPTTASTPTASHAWMYAKSLDADVCEREAFVFVKPRCFMNVSGRIVAPLLRAYSLPPEALLLAHDDVELPLGRAALRLGGSAKGHRGVQSVADSLRTLDFHRVRIGVGRPAAREDMANYVLQRFPGEQLQVLRATVFPLCTQLCVEHVLGGDARNSTGSPGRTAPEKPAHPPAAAHAATQRRGTDAAGA